jgi:adenosine kinase
MSSNILVSGSVAFDVIMSYEGNFSKAIDTSKGTISAAFLIQELKKHFGGCAANICYNLKLLEQNPILLGSVGCDFNLYKKDLESKGISTEFIKVHNDIYTAQAFITTDDSGSQLTSFYPGAMNSSHLNEIPNTKIDIAIISPDGYQGMMKRVEECTKRDIKFLFDPGQALPVFSRENLIACAENASFLAFNEYEWEFFQRVSGLTVNDLKELDKIVIVTLGAEGSCIYSNESEIFTPSIKGIKPVDPTGCGDAYRAGLLYGYTNGLNWNQSAQVATTMGAFAVQYFGTQNHTFNKKQFNVTLEENFDFSLR